MYMVNMFDYERLFKCLMAGAEEQVPVASLEETPTWAVAVVCFILISISILFEHGFHLLTKHYGRRRKSLNKALYKIKTELMTLGFISLLLTISQGPISKICIPKGAGDTFRPCKSTYISSDVVEEGTCAKRGKISLLSKQGVEHLQMLIFVLALFHIVSCILTFTLGMAKMRRWRAWEEETTTLDYQFSNDPRRFRLTHQTSFARRHLKFWSDHRILRWPACFIRQFNGSVSKTDYFILRHGFITAHLAESSRFDFQKFIQRALDEDFQVVVGMSLWVWIFSVFFIFFHAHGFYNYFWLPFIPLVTLLLVGTKLQNIITQMFLQSRSKSTVVRGTFLVKPSDHLFWFSRPRLLLHIIYFVLFQNSFQLAFFSWTWFKYGFRSCFHRQTEDIVLRIVVGVLVQLLCGYVTLPLYALVTQMGSSMRKAVFTEPVVAGLRNWHKTAKKNVATSKTTSLHPSRDASTQNSPQSSREPPVEATVIREEIEAVPLDHPLPHLKYMIVDEKVDGEVQTGKTKGIVNEVKEEEEEEGQKEESEGIYNGEVSFAWYR